MELVDHTSEKNTYENLRKYEEIDHNNHVYGMFTGALRITATRR